MNVTQSQTQTLQDILNWFFENPIEVKIKFNVPVVITTEEFNEMIGKPDSTNGTINDNVYLDQYVYDEGENIAKISVEYYVVGEFVHVLEINMWRERAE